MNLRDSRKGREILMDCGLILQEMARAWTLRRNQIYVSGGYRKQAVVASSPRPCYTFGTE